MTLPQMLAVSIIGAMMIAFIWGRLRYDLIACLALLASVAAGTVTYRNAFSGFSDDIVIIVGSALLVSSAVQRSGIMEVAIRKYLPISPVCGRSLSFWLASSPFCRRL